MRISIRKPHKVTSKWHKSRIICNFFARKFVNSLKISKLSILESEKETAIEKAGVKVVTNYENLIENYQPALNELVQAATEIDTILFKYAEAQQRFNKVQIKIHFKGSSDPSHSIIEINVGKRRIRHGTTLKLNF